jgi:hypothetical protein
MRKPLAVVAVLLGLAFAQAYTGPVLKSRLIPQISYLYGAKLVEYEAKSEGCPGGYEAIFWKERDIIKFSGLSEKEIIKSNYAVVKQFYAKHIVHKFYLDIKRLGGTILLLEGRPVPDGPYFIAGQAPFAEFKYRNARYITEFLELAGEDGRSLRFDICKEE